MDNVRELIRKAYSDCTNSEDSAKEFVNSNVRYIDFVNKETED